MKLEICVGDVDGVLTAEHCGADRAELCHRLDIGGITPTIEDVSVTLDKLIKRRNQIHPHHINKPDPRRHKPFGLQIIIRPRGGSFEFTDTEAAQMVRQIKAIRTEAEARSEQLQRCNVKVGYVVGANRETETAIDVETIRRLRNAAGDATLTFHRAFDEIPNWQRALADLKNCGVDRVLTTGKTAGPLTEGLGYSIDGLAALQASTNITVLASGRIRAETYRPDLAHVGICEIHQRAPRPDGTTDPTQIQATLKVLSCK